MTKINRLFKFNLKKDISKNLKLQINYRVIEGGRKMKLYLIQHGEAKTEIEDPERSLTLKGEQEVRKVSNVAKMLNIFVPKIYHSGKLRAKQTAEILGEALKTSVEQSDGLNPLDNFKPWSERISKSTEDIMIVGHLPFLEKLASYLLCGDENARLILFRYGAIVCLEQKEDKGWAVKWILTPEMIP